MILFTVVLIVLLCILSGGFVFAKYFTDLGNSDGTVKAGSFYFTSNLLDGESHTLAPGSESVTFTLGNHADDLRYSEVDITYTVTVDNGATVDKATGTLTKGVVNDVKITISNLAPGKTYKVTAEGKGGYSKTLTATIVVPADKSKLYYDTDTSVSEYTLLTVWNEGNASGTVTITYTGIPDNTNPNMTDWTTNGSDKSVTLEPYESKVFRFFGETVAITVTGAKPKSLS